jgi:hypothetical protein
LSEKPPRENQRWKIEEEIFGYGHHFGGWAGRMRKEKKENKKNFRAFMRAMAESFC